MSAGPQPQPAITVSEMQARLSEVAQQRDLALNRCAILAGEKSVLIEGLTAARAEIDGLRAAAATGA